MQKKRILPFIIILMLLCNITAVGVEKDYKYYYDIALKFELQKKYSKAYHYYNVSISLNPNDYLSYFGKGNCDIHLNRKKLSIQDFTQVLKLKPDYANAYYNRALSYYNLNDFKNSLKDNNKYLSIKPKDAQAYINRAGCYLHLKQEELAYADYKKALSLDPKNAFAKSQLAKYNPKKQ